MSNTPLQDLMDELEKELFRMHYTKQAIKFYRQIWKRIARFFEKEGVDQFAEEVGMRFLEEKYNFFELEKAGKLTQSIINVFRVVRMLGDFQQHGSVLRRYFKHIDLLQNNDFKELLQYYTSYCQQRDYSKVTQDHYRKNTELFLSFLESQKIEQISDTTAKHISAYINTLLGYSYKTVELHLCSLRSFLHYIHAGSLHSQDLAETIPPLKARKQNRIPSVWTPEHLTRLFEAIDRGNPAGKRGYAMILPAACLGLRISDIKHLKLENLKWRDNRIELVQSKTSRPLSLPPDIISNPLFDEDVIKGEKSAIDQELRSRAHSSAGMIDEILSLIYGPHPLANPVGGNINPSVP
jgi:hypothetical protein